MNAVYPIRPRARLIAMRLLLVLVILGTANLAAADDVRAVLAYETGPAYIVQNDGEYGAGGTRYHASDVGQQDNLVRVSRTSLELARGRHRVVLLYAPFDVTTTVTLADDLQFRDTRFPAGTVVAHRYLFDGYRSSYLYTALDRGPVALEVGGSIQIRNAEVAFESRDGALRDAETDIGVVFAAKARLWYRPSSTRAWGALDVDAFSTFGLVPGVRGAIYDTQLMAGYPIAKDADLVLGARLVGGGADVADRDIYNWANFVSFTVGARLTR